MQFLKVGVIVDNLRSVFHVYCVAGIAHGLCFESEFAGRLWSSQSCVYFIYYKEREILKKITSEWTSLVVIVSMAVL